MRCCYLIFECHILLIYSNGKKKKQVEIQWCNRQTKESLQENSIVRRVTIQGLRHSKQSKWDFRRIRKEKELSYSQPREKEIVYSTVGKRLKYHNQRSCITKRDQLLDSQTYIQCLQKDGKSGESRYDKTNE